MWCVLVRFGCVVVRLGLIFVRFGGWHVCKVQGGVLCKVRIVFRTILYDFGGVRVVRCKVVARYYKAFE
jgi:hypothetical protein